MGKAVTEMAMVQWNWEKMTVSLRHTLQALASTTMGMTTTLQL